MKNTKWIAPVLASTVIISAMTGCMITPNNNDNIGTRNSLAIAMGYLVEPNEEVYLEARVMDPADDQYGQMVDVSYNVISRSNYVVRSSNRVADTSGTAWNGGDLYQWTMFYHIPDRCWRWDPGERKYKALLRVRSNGTTLANGNLYMFENGFFDQAEDVDVAAIGDWAVDGNTITIWANR